MTPDSHLFTSPQSLEIPEGLSVPSPQVFGDLLMVQFAAKALVSVQQLLAPTFDAAPDSKVPFLSEQKAAASEYLEHIRDLMRRFVAGEAGAIKIALSHRFPELLAGEGSKHVLGVSNVRDLLDAECEALLSRVAKEQQPKIRKSWDRCLRMLSKELFPQDGRAGGEEEADMRVLQVLTRTVRRFEGDLTRTLEPRPN
jgi:hypothetical protein